MNREDYVEKNFDFQEEKRIALEDEMLKINCYKLKMCPFDEEVPCNNTDYDKCRDCTIQLDNLAKIIL